MRSTAQLAAVLTAFALAGGCADSDNVSLVVVKNVVPDEMCVVDPGGVALLGGVFDAALAGNSYEAYVVFRNALVTRRGTDLSSDVNGIFVTSAEVELRGADGETPLGISPNPFMTVMSTFVDSGGGESGSLVQLIPPGVAGAVPAGQTIVAAVRFFGETQGGVAVETDEWLWPIQVCSGCLAVCDAEMMLEPTCDVGQDALYHDASLCPAPATP